TDLDATANGKLGAEALAWIYQATHTPSALQLRAPIEVADAALALSGGNDIRFKGRFSIAGGPVFGVEGRRTAKTLEIGKVTVKDAVSDASFGGKLADRKAEGWFKGQLFGETLVHTFVEAAPSVGELKGDFVAAANLDKIEHFTARGHLEGSSIKLATLLPVPIEAQRLAISADGARITVSEARLSSGDSQVEVVGTFERRGKKFTLDADFRSDRIVVPTLPSASGSDRPDRSTKISLADLPIDGRIGVSIKHLQIEALEISPLIAGATLADAKRDLDIIDAAICGINLSGGLTGEKGDIKVHALLKSRNAELDRSITCLTGAHLQASGRFDLDAQFTTQGTADTLEQSLRGTFSATARNGNLKKMDTLNKIFGVLNVTEAVRGKNLEIAPVGMPYRTMSARGTLDGKLIHFEEAMLDAPTVWVAATGDVDINTDKVSVDVLVAPLQTANAILDYVPLLNRIFGGSVLAVPVRVTGTLKHPIVVPLGPGAVVRHLTDIIGNVLKLPVDAITIIAPKAQSSDGSPPADVSK
ncbi:MAG: AsmA-like C-terminal domain-containing protein, partial [Burkholderiales bacterium]